MIDVGILIIMEELFNGSFDPVFSGDVDDDSTAQVKEMESGPPECPKATDWKNTKYHFHGEERVNR